LIASDQRVRHVGMHLGFNGRAGYTLRNAALPDGDYGFLLTAPRQVSCISAAAMMMRRSLFEELNGFDPMLATSLHDVDLCMRAIRTDARLIVDPRCALVHVESHHEVPEPEYAHFQARWGDRVSNDPWLNDLFDANDESLRTLKL